MTNECKCCDSTATTVIHSPADGEMHLCDNCAAEFATHAEPRREWNQAMGCWVGEENAAIIDAAAIAKIVDDAPTS